MKPEISQAQYIVLFRITTILYFYTLRIKPLQIKAYVTLCPLPPFATFANLRHS